MSMGLDSPMEAALAINYLSQLHGGVAANINYVWAWIAFLTAAISFWKIKLSSSIVRSSLHLQLNSPTCSLSSSSPSTSTSEKEEAEKLPTASLTTSSSSNSRSSSNSTSRYTTSCSIENRRSGKFSMYYYNNNNEDNTSNLNETDTTKSKLADRRLRNGCLVRHHPREEEEEESLVNRSSINYFQRQQQQGWEWEPLLLKMKTTEMVWYNYQDLTLLNGNVVRFWN